MQPGTGYIFDASSKGQTLGIQETWPAGIDAGPKRLVIELYQPHPFRITKLNIETVMLAGWFYNFYPQTGPLYTVLPGTVNSFPVIFPGFAVCDDKLTYIYVQTYPEADVDFIISRYPISNSEYAAYILIGTIDENGINQYVKSNIHRERYKLGQQAADYHHSYTDLI
jgi:hypothetical protein